MTSDKAQVYRSLDVLLSMWRGQEAEKLLCCANSNTVKALLKLVARLPGFTQENLLGWQQSKATVVQ